jgi:ATP-dependent Clp protease protease subunit
MFLPDVIETTGRSTRAFSLPTKLLQERIIYLGTDVNDFTANAVVMQLLWLSADDSEKDIYLYINSPGGVVTEGMAIYDVINAIPNKVNTVCLGQACSMGAFLLSSGTGYRAALKHARIMVHQPSGGAAGMASDIEIQFKEIQRMKEELTRILANNTNGATSYDAMVKMSDRDTFMSAEEALSAGLIDKIITSI